MLRTSHWQSGRTGSALGQPVFSNPIKAVLDTVPLGGRRHQWEDLRLAACEPFQEAARKRVVWPADMVLSGARFPGDEGVDQTS